MTPTPADRQEAERIVDIAFDMVVIEKSPSFAWEWFCEQVQRQLYHTVASALAAQRERDAMTANDFTQNSNHTRSLSSEMAYELACREIAAAIRGGS